MANTLSAYNPVFYAQQALLQLEKALGLAARVFRGYDDDNTGRERGSTIDIRIPSTFTAAAAPSTAQDITANKTTVTLDQWKEVKFSLTDKELAWTSQRIIDEHIRPATFAIADDIDQALAALVDDVPYYVDLSSPAAVADITGARKVLFNNKVNVNDPMNLHMMLDGTAEDEFLQLAAFSQHQGGGDMGVDTQMRGTIGRKYGFEVFANQNTPSRTSNTAADTVGAINNGAGYVAGTTSIAIDGMTAAAALKAGDIVQITGHSQQYVLTADVTLSSGAGTLTIFGSPFIQQGGLESAVVDDQVVTIVMAGDSGGTKVQNLAFHRDWAALAMARLPDFMNGEGVRVFSVRDPVTGLAVRARTWADGDNSAYKVALDVLYGVKTLDGNKACRIRD